MYVQLTNVHPDTDIAAIRDYIKDKDATLDPIEVKDTSSVGWQTKRFLVTFASVAEEKVLSSEFWPGKIYYKKWFAPRSRQSNDTQSS